MGKREQKRLEMIGRREQTRTQIMDMLLHESEADPKFTDRLLNRMTKLGKRDDPLARMISLLATLGMSEIIESIKDIT